ncbi:MAG: isopentenyl phosphate kinase family protein [Anaerolineaceae bacterium]|nr:isopentenyl phosphate kinase family protein [Anaerolineaceae bacterium]
METPRELVLLKLGGSLITDKSQPLTAREDVIQQLAGEVAAYHATHPETQLILGHGSGSFGHAVAHQYQTQSGVHSPEEWLGFAEVWAAAHQLNQIVIRHFSAAGLPVVTFAPSAGIIADQGEVLHWDLAPLQAALTHDLIPVVLGDVIFDRSLGGTIFSTEKVFQHLAKVLQPTRILLAGIEKGVYQNPANPDQIFPKITPSTLGEIRQQVSGSHQVDVTGGMESKVALMLNLVSDNPELTVRIFSATAPGHLQNALEGENLGTLIAA